MKKLETRVNGIEGYLTAAHAARLLGISIEALYRRLERHQVPILRVGRSILVRWSDLRPEGGQFPRQQ